MSKSPNLHRHNRRLLTSLPSTQPQTIHLRDGELVLYSEIFSSFLELQRLDQLLWRNHKIYLVQIDPG